MTRTLHHGIYEALLDRELKEALDRHPELRSVFGTVIGLAGAAVATRAIVTLLYGVSRLDPVTYLGVVALLLAVSGIACWIPAYRAARVDPATTLRSE